MSQTLNLQNEIEKELGFTLNRKINNINNEKDKDDFLLDKLSHLKEPLKKFDKIEPLLKKILKITPRSELIWAILGYIYYLKSDFQKSIKCFFKTIEINPLNLDNWIDIGFAYRAYGDAQTSDFIFLHYKELINEYLTALGRIDGPFLLELIRSVQNNIYYRGKILNLNKNLISINKPLTKKIKKKILLINPPIEEPFIEFKNNNKLLNTLSLESRQKLFKNKNSFFIKKGFGFNLPIGLLRIANQLLKDGNEIYFLDCFASLPPTFPNSKLNLSKLNTPKITISEDLFLHQFHLGLSYKKIEEILKTIEVDEIYVGCTFTYYNESAHKVIDLCKKTFPHSKIIFGGIYPTLAPKEAMKSKADKIYTGKYIGLKDLSLNYKILGYNPGYIIIKGTNGCPYNCAYCAVHNLEGNKFSFRNPKEVFEEIIKTNKEQKTKEIVLWESNILMDYENYLKPILKKIQNSKIDFKIGAPEGFDYRFITQERANDLKKTGFEVIGLALENYDTKFTKNKLNRANDLQKLKSAINYLKKAGFKGQNIRIFVIIGLPNQPLKNVIKSIKFIWSLGCNALIFPFTPIPGTKLYNDNYSTLKKFKFKELHPLFHPCTENKKELKYLVELSLFNILCDEHKSQKKHLNEILFSKELIKMLS